MLRIRLSSVALAAALVAAAAAPAYAQSGTVTATADVVTPLTVTSISALAFGNVYPGVAKTVAPADASSRSRSIPGAVSSFAQGTR